MNGEKQFFFEKNIIFFQLALNTHLNQSNMLNFRVKIRVIAFLLPFQLSAQNDTLQGNYPIQQQNILEDYLQQTEQDADFDFNTLYENLERYRAHPLNMNLASEEELAELGLLSSIQIASILDYRRQSGNFIALYELQAVEELDLNTIRILLPYISLTGDLDDYQVSLKKMLREGKNDLYFRWQRTLQTAEGYRPLAEGEEAARYLGDPNKLYFRYKHNYENRLSYGITAEKDAGEEFFKGNNSFGFDFYSAHVFLQNYSKRIRAIAIGDYSIRMGQGLIANSGFGGSKSSFVTALKREGKTLKAYSSVNETSFLRGAGATIGLGKHFEWTTFGSLRRRDANILERDTLDISQDDVLNFSSLLNSGLHRTTSEVEDKNTLQQTTLGTSLRYLKPRFKLGFNFLYDSFNKVLEPRTQLYNQYYFSGNRHWNASIDYTYIYRNAHFFGETAIGANGQMATLNALLLGLDRYVDLAILYRYYPKDYQALNANPFGETRGGRNESGLYLGLLLKPYSHVEIGAYIDFYQHPWLRFNADAPSRGHDWLFRFTYTQKRQSRMYLEFKGETKEQNNPFVDINIDPLYNRERYLSRLYFSRNISKSIELRSRLDVGLVPANEWTERQTGILFFQDIIFKAIDFPLSFSTRFAIFDAPYALRFYAYENDLLYTFSIPAYFNQGTRFYLNLRYKGIQNMVIEARYAQTFYNDQENIGSGLEAIDNNRRGEVKFQIKYRF